MTGAVSILYILELGEGVIAFMSILPILLNVQDFRYQQAITSAGT